MATLSGLTVFAPGDVINSSPMNQNFNVIKTFVENLSAGANFDAGAINSEDIAGSAIIEGKIANGAVTTGKLGTSLSLTSPNINNATATSIAVTLNVVYHIQTNATAGAYTLVLADDGKIVEMNNGSGTTLTVPLNSSVAFPVGTQITILQTGTGQTTVAGATVGVTIDGTPGLKLRTRWSAATLIKRAENTWVLVGDLSA
jgi:hypothetical protein